MVQSSFLTSNITIPDNDRLSLKIAVESDNHHRVQILVERNESRGDIEEWKTVYREFFSLAKSKEVGDLLIQHGADIKSRGKSGTTFLMETSSIRVLDYLINDQRVHPEPRDDEGRTALRRTVEVDDDREKAKFLITHGRANVNAFDDIGRTVLMTAIHRNRRDFFGLLLSHGADCKAEDYRGRTALHHLASGKEREYEYDPTRRDLQQQLDEHFLQGLLSVDDNLYVKDGKGRTCLHDLARFGSTGLVKVFLQNGRFKVGFDPEDNEARTPLHAACEAENDDPGLVRLLLEHGADPKKKIKNGRTPLHVAAGAGNVRIVRTLSSLPIVDRHARDIFGNTLIMDTANIQKTKQTREISSSCLLLGRSYILCLTICRKPRSYGLPTSSILTVNLGQSRKILPCLICFTRMIQSIMIDLLIHCPLFTKINMRSDGFIFQQTMWLGPKTCLRSITSKRTPWMSILSCLWNSL